MDIVFTYPKGKKETVASRSAGYISGRLKDALRAKVGNFVVECLETGSSYDVLKKGVKVLSSVGLLEASESLVKEIKEMTTAKGGKKK